MRLKPAPTLNSAARVNTQEEQSTHQLVAGALWGLSEPEFLGSPYSIPIPDALCLGASEVRRGGASLPGDTHRKPGVLAVSCCHNNTAQARWCKRRKCVFSRFWCWKSKIKEPAGLAASSQLLSPQLADGCRLAVSSRGLFSVYVHSWCLFFF